MNQVVLTGLHGDLPIGAMAAFGVFRVCDSMRDLAPVRLHWVLHEGRYVATLTTAIPLSSSQLTSRLIQHLHEAVNRKELLWADQIKGTKKNCFRDAAFDALGRANRLDRSEADFFAAFASESVVDGEETLEPTPFDMTIARQRFLGDARRLAAALANPKHCQSSRDSFQEALYGPWRYGDDQHSLGWDPSTTRLGAYTHRAPTEMANAGVRGAVWLAFEAMPLFPCFCIEGQIRARAFLYGKRSLSFSWPIWSAPISLPALKSVLSLPEITGNEILHDEMEGRGIMAVFRSRRAKPNKYMIAFQPAILCAGGLLVPSQRLGGARNAGTARDVATSGGCRS